MTGLEQRSRPSPCVGVCQLDGQTGLCLGCARTGEEIASWANGTSDWHDAIWESLPTRFATLGITIHRLPWSQAEIFDFVTRTLKERSGTWVLGIYGAVGEFCVSADEDLRLSVDGDVIEAVTERAAIRLQLGSKVRALTAGVSDDDQPRIMLAMPMSRARTPQPVCSGLTDLGPDAKSIRGSGQTETLFDLGLGRETARFAIRLDEPSLADGLSAAQGIGLSDLFAVFGRQIVSDSPTRVIETCVGRVEIDTPIPPPDGTSPPGPHTHLLPDHLEMQRDTAPDIPLPDAYRLGAIYYPNSR